jgi:N-acetylmuramoyl-L-alanine amidase
MALKLKEMLEKEGASVVMTRRGAETVPLTERPKIARAGLADVFVSVHANALPEEEDPYSKPRGFMVFYYHPQSLPLARAVHAQYQRWLGPAAPTQGGVQLADEGFQYGDLLVARQTQMPAILMESAYLMFPEQEALLTDPNFQEIFARAMLEGLRSYFEEARSLQAENPAERRAAY